MINDSLLAVFKEFELTLYNFDHAKDVADGGLPMLGREMEEEATAKIRQMFELVSDLQVVMPQLWSELRNSENIADRLPNFYGEIHKARSHVRYLVVENEVVADRKVSKCEECGSDYFKDLSCMTDLCLECAHVLYGYEPCTHSFVDGRCSRCHWDGSTSKYIKKLKSKPSDVHADRLP